MTPAEHLALPNVEDVKQGIMASKIAAHAADIAKGIPHARDIDDRMADARRALDWEGQWACAPGSGNSQSHPGGPESGTRRHLFHVRKVLRGPQHEQSPGGRIHRYPVKERDPMREDFEKGAGYEVR